ncbi:MAG: hypothetical protein JWM28_3488 [Chitinophagaceae bacterium]|nr:hypothetical protein [Chitinophagaceae bacterium]
MKQNILFVLCSVILLTVGSCKKGDIGPQGTTGPQGPAGPQGAIGTANVIYSDWFTPAVYTKDTIFGIWGFNYNQAATAITQQVLDSGAVLTFGKLHGYNPGIWPAGQVAQLPVNLTYIVGSTMTDTWSALATVGNLKIRFVNDLNFYNSISTSHQFRFIVVPSGIPGARMEQLTYQEICKKYSIPE